MRTIALIVLALAACKSKPDQQARCHDVVEHMRSVTTMPMRDGDVAMMMGACKMWEPATIDCLMAAKNDDDIARCKKS